MLDSDDFETKLWKRGSSEYIAWRGYVDGAMEYMPAWAIYSKKPYLAEEAEDYVKNLYWSKNDE